VEQHHTHDIEQDLQEAREAGLSDEFYAHALTPQNVGMLPNPDGHAMPKGACGDYIELFLRIDDDLITDARFMPEGCLNTVACGSAVTSLAKGASLREAAEIDAERIEGLLGGLHKDHRHCAVLAAATLKAAIRDYLKKRSEPWKRPYAK